MNMFRNLTLFRFAPSVAASLTPQRLDLGFSEHRLREPGPVELATAGFVSPFGDNSERMLHQSSPFALFALGYAQRLLPNAIVIDALSKRIDAVATREARRVGGRERKRLREEVIAELLPQAFIRRTRVMAYVDVRDGWLVVDTASRRVAESVVSEVRRSLGRFPVLPLATEESPQGVMTQCLIDAKPPDGYLFGDECNLRDPAEGGGKWNGRAIDLESEEVREHLKAGMQVFRLELNFTERCAFVLDESLVVRKFRLLDAASDELSDEGHESNDLELAATFALMAGEIKELLKSLSTLFALERPEDRE